MTPRPPRSVVARGSTLARRALLGGAAGLALAACADRASPPVTPTRHRYGRHPQQFGDLYLPPGREARGTIVVVHGGFWQQMYGLSLGADTSADLARRGWAAWNIEYRRLGDGGGWPTTCADVAAAVDGLARLPGVPTGRVVGLGHSAGGQLAVWAASRDASTPGGRPRVKLHAAVSQAGVLQLARAAESGLGGTAVPDLVGGMPDRLPERYALVDPSRRVPIGVPVRCVHGTGDTTVPLSQSSGFVRAAREAGDDAELVTVPGDHFALIDSTTAAWRRTVRVLDDLGPGGG